MARSNSRTSTARARSAGAAGIAVGAALLRRLPLEAPQADDSKQERGRVLIIGGSREVPGAMRLAAEAALQSGAGRLHIATVESAAMALALAVPEARVTALPETSAGEIAPKAAGMLDPRGAGKLVRTLRAKSAARWILDAAAIAGCEIVAGTEGRSPAIVTPHAGEMERLLDDLHLAHDVEADPAGCALAVAAAVSCIAVCKGAITWIAGPGPQLFRHVANLPGLGTSGSGDVLAGIMVGLAARESDLLRCAIWGVHLHAQAGAALARRRGTVGFLAREIAFELPRLLSLALEPTAPRRNGQPRRAGNRATRPA